MDHYWQALKYKLMNRRFVKDSGLLLLANVIVTGLGAIRTPLMTWVIPKEQVGMIGVVASWIPFVHLLSLSGMDAASYHYVAKGDHWAFIINISRRLKWSLLSALALVVGGSYWLWKGEAPLGWMFFVTGLLFPATNGLTAVAGTLGGQERYTHLFWYRLCESLVDFVGFIPLLLSMWWMNQVFTFYTANQLATGLMLVIYSIWIWRQLRMAGAPRPPPDEEQALLRYGRHQTALNVISILQTRSDAFLVGSFLSLNTMADYSIALLVSEQFKRLWVVYLSVRYPPLVRLSPKRLIRRLIFEGAVIMLGFAGAGIVLYLLARWLIPVILPGVYASSIPYIGWLTASFVVSIPGFFAEVYFRTQQDEGHQYVMRTLAAVIGVTLPLLLIRSWGIIGVVTGRFLSGLMLSIVGIALIIIVNARLSPSQREQ